MNVVGGKCKYLHAGSGARKRRMDGCRCYAGQVGGLSGRVRTDHRWWTTPTRLVDVIGLAAEGSDCGSGGVATAAIRHSAALAKAL